MLGGSCEVLEKGKGVIRKNTPFVQKGRVGRSLRKFSVFFVVSHGEIDDESVAFDARLDALHLLIGIVQVARDVGGGIVLIFFIEIVEGVDLLHEAVIGDLIRLIEKLRVGCVECADEILEHFIIAAVSDISIVACHTNEEGNEICLVARCRVGVPFRARL